MNYSNSPENQRAVTAEVEIWRSGPRRISISLEKTLVAHVTDKALPFYEKLDEFLQSQGA